LRPAVRAGVVGQSYWQSSASAIAASQAVIGISKQASAKVANPFPTLSLYQNPEPGLLERLGGNLKSRIVEPFEMSDTRWSGLGYSAALAYVGLFGSWIWFPILDLFYSALGLERTYSEILASITYGVLCLTAGFKFAISRERKKILYEAAAPPAGGQTTTARTYQAPQPLPALATTSGTASPRRAPAKSQGLVGNNITLKYHSPSCWWALCTFGVNLRKFRSNKEAENEGFRRCKECLP